MDRSDGWPGIRDRYGLPQRDVRGLDHDLAYRALASGEIQATDLYSTDAEIRQYNSACSAMTLASFRRTNASGSTVPICSRDRPRPSRP